MDNNNYISVMLLILAGVFVTIFLGYMQFLHFDLEACRSSLCACEDPVTGQDYHSGIKSMGGYCKYSDAIIYYLTNKITLIIYAGWVFISIVSYILLRNNENEKQIEG